MAAAALSGSRLGALIADIRDDEGQRGYHYAIHPLRRPASVLEDLGIWGMLHGGLRPGQVRRRILVVLGSLGDGDGLRALRALPDREILRQAAAGIDRELEQHERALHDDGGGYRRLGEHVAAIVAALRDRVSSPGSHARAPRPRAARRTRACASRDGPSDPSSRPRPLDLAAGAAA